MSEVDAAMLRLALGADPASAATDFCSTGTTAPSLTVGVVACGKRSTDASKASFKAIPLKRAFSLREGAFSISTEGKMLPQERTKCT